MPAALHCTRFGFCCVYTLYMCTFGVFWVCVCDGAIMYVLCYMYYTCTWMYGVFILISVLHRIYSHSGLEGDQMVGEIVIIMQWE